MFGRLYLAELKKQARPKLLIIFGAIGIVFIVLALLLNILMEKTISSLDSYIYTDPIANEIGMAEVSDIDDFEAILGEYTKNTVSYSKAECERLLPQYKAEYEQAKAYAQKHSYAYRSGIDFSTDAFSYSEYYADGDYVYAARARYNMIKFIDDNGYYDKEFIVYSGTSTTYATDATKSVAEDLLGSMDVFFMTVATIFAIVVGALSITSEIKTGTIKLMLLRPTSREKFLGAKFLSGYTLVFGFYTVGFLIATIISYCMYGASGATLMFIFNSTDVYFGSASLGILYTYIFDLVTLTAYYVLAFGLGTMLKNTAASIILPLVADTVALLFQVAGIGAYWFTNAINWGAFFGTYGSSLLGGSHYAIAFLMTTAYIVLLGGGAFFTFHRRDAA